MIRDKSYVPEPDSSYVPREHVDEKKSCINLDNNTSVLYRDSAAKTLRETVFGQDELLPVTIQTGLGMNDRKIVYVKAADLKQAAAKTSSVEEVRKLQSALEAPKAEGEVSNALNAFLTSTERAQIKAAIELLLERGLLSEEDKEKMESYLLSALAKGKETFSCALEPLFEITQALKKPSLEALEGGCSKVQISLEEDSHLNPYYAAAGLKEKGLFPVGDDRFSFEYSDFVLKLSTLYSLHNLSSMFSANVENQLVCSAAKFDESPELSQAIPRSIDTSTIGEKAKEDIADRMDAVSFQSPDNKARMIVFSTADGSGKGLDAGAAAEAANKGFIDYFKRICLQGAPIRSSQDLVKHMVMAVDAGQEAILDKKIKKSIRGVDSVEPINGFTTHLGLTALIDNENETVHACFTTIGDSKLLAKLPDGTIIDLTQDIHRPDPFNFKDPGGQLGRKYKVRQEEIYGEKPDLRNFTAAYFTVPKGTVFLPMSDGVHDNFDPVTLKIPPLLAFEELSPEDAVRFKCLKPIEGAIWTSSANDQAIRQAYLLSKIKVLTAGDNGDGAETVKKIVATAVEHGQGGGKRDDACLAWVITA